MGFILENPLSQRLVLAKPIEQAANEDMLVLQDKGKLIVERKRNGHSTPIAITNQRSNSVGIYSRSIKALTDNFPHHVEALRALNISPGTLMQSENSFSDSDGVERSGFITRFAGSGKDRSLQLQEELGISKLAFFNILFYKGVPIAHWPYKDRLDLLREILAKNQHPALELVEVLEGSLPDLQKLSIEKRWEGLVLLDADAATEFRTDGNHDRPPRPYGCWKWKDYLEGDFVITGWIPSTAKRHYGLVKDFKIAQHDPLTGELVDWGVCGNGLSAAERKLYADDSLYPMVFEIKFESRTPNQRLTLAQLLRRRTDKAPSECFSPTDS